MRRRENFKIENPVFLHFKKVCKTFAELVYTGCTVNGVNELIHVCFFTF